MSDVEALLGDELPPLRWWQSEPARRLMGMLTLVAFFAPWLVWGPDEVVAWFGDRRLPTYQLTAGGVGVLMALLLLPIARRASYRKRDFFIVTLVPFYGEYVAAKIVHRALRWPRCNWEPRLDQLPRVVRIPGGHGDWMLARSYDMAERIRVRWCRNHAHQHPYDAWDVRTHIGCVRPSAVPAVATPADGP